LGRLVTYLGLGAAAGSIGRALDLAGGALGIAHVAAVATGVVLLLSGALAFAPTSKLLKLRKRPARGASSLLAPLLGRFRASHPALRALVLGLSSTLLPCGWLYSFAALAAGVGSAFGGAWLMSAFWVGSLPVMLGVGISLQTLTRRFASRLSRLRPVAILVAGGVTLLTHLQLPAFAAEARSPAAAATLPSSKDCPCHRHGVSAVSSVPSLPHDEARP
jgi:sulfite exporter TauE/SafE